MAKIIPFPGPADRYLASRAAAARPTSYRTPTPSMFPTSQPQVGLRTMPECKIPHPFTATT
jgi:hypothetical protein